MALLLVLFQVCYVFSVYFHFRNLFRITTNRQRFQLAPMVTLEHFSLIPSHKAEFFDWKSLITLRELCQSVRNLLADRIASTLLLQSFQWTGGAMLLTTRETHAFARCCLTIYKPSIPTLDNLFETQRTVSKFLNSREGLSPSRPSPGEDALFKAMFIRTHDALSLGHPTIKARSSSCL